MTFDLTKTREICEADKEKLLPSRCRHTIHRSGCSGCMDFYEAVKKCETARVEFNSHARTALPEACDVIEELQGEIANLRNQREAYRRVAMEHLQSLDAARTMYGEVLDDQAAIGEVDIRAAEILEER